MDTDYLLILFVKIIILGQITLIIFFIVMMYLTKMFFYFRNTRDSKRGNKIQSILYSQLDKQEPFSQSTIVLLRRGLRELLKVIPDVKNKGYPPAAYRSLINQLSDEVFKPKARRWAYSKMWQNRFDAVIAYHYGVDPQDEKQLLKLLHDPSILISINAAEIVVEHNLIKLINEMITKFSKYRYLEQSLILDQLLSWKSNISSIVLNRLDHDENINIRIFCYRILTLYPQPKIISSIKLDLSTDSNDLKIAIIYYLIHCNDDKKNDLLYPLVNEQDSSVRAMLATALGSISTNKSIELLSLLLCDKAWKVSYNSACSLYEHGATGIEILKKQLISQNKLAHDMAFSVLTKKEAL